TASLWSVSTRQLSRRWDIGDGAVSVCFFPGSSRFAVACDGGEARILDAGSRSEVRRIRCRPRDPADRLTTLCVSHDGKILMYAGCEDVIRFWNLAEDRELQGIAQKDAWFVSLTPDDRMVAATGPDTGGPVRLFDPLTGRLIREFGDGIVDGFWSVAFSPDG